MLKHVAAIVILSILVITSMTYAQQGLNYLLSAHDWLSEMLTDVFSGGNTGNLIRQLLALLIIPVLIGFVPAFIYWLVKRHWFPYFMELVWAIWLVQTAALVILYKVAA